MLARARTGGWPRWRRCGQRRGCPLGHARGVVVRGVAARAVVSATLEVLTRAPTRGALYRGWPRERKKVQRRGCPRGHPQGVPLRGVAARAVVSATLEVLTRAPTRGALYRGWPRERKKVQRRGCPRGHPQGVPLRGAAARAGVSATLEVLTRARTRGGLTGGGRASVRKCNDGGVHEGTHKGCPYGVSVSIETVGKRGCFYG